MDMEFDVFVLCGCFQEALDEDVHALRTNDRSHEAEADALGGSLGQGFHVAEIHAIGGMDDLVDRNVAVRREHVG